MLNNELVSFWWSKVTITSQNMLKYMVPFMVEILVRGYMQVDGIGLWRDNSGDSRNIF